MSDCNCREAHCEHETLPSFGPLVRARVALDRLMMTSLEAATHELSWTQADHEALCRVEDLVREAAETEGQA